MENVQEIEKVVEEVVENVQEIIPTPAVNEKVGVTAAKAAGIAALVYTAFEGGKWALGKIRKAASKRKEKKDAVRVEEVDVATVQCVIDDVE